MQLNSEGEAEMDVVGIVLAILGILVAIYFGVRSMFQSSDMEDLQRAVRVNSQAMYNHLWRIGGRCNVLLQRDDLSVETRQFVTGFNETSIAARSWLVAFSREYAQFVPKFEVAWEPLELPPERPRPLWRRLFFLSEAARPPGTPIDASDAGSRTTRPDEG
jgi:hypothetical protein